MTHPVYGRIEGAVVIIGFGSIGKGTLPLIERHFGYDASKQVVIDPDLATHTFLDKHGHRHLQLALTPENYREVLSNLLGQGGLYMDTVVEPRKGFYFETPDNADLTNYALRQQVRDHATAHSGGPTAVSCCGANPGMVSWFVKED